MMATAGAADQVSRAAASAVAVVTTAVTGAKAAAALTATGTAQLSNHPGKYHSGAEYRRLQLLEKWGFHWTQTGTLMTRKLFPLRSQ